MNFLPDINEKQREENMCIRSPSGRVSPHLQPVCDVFPFTWRTSGYYSHNYCAAPASYLPINCRPNTERRSEAGNHGNEIKSWFGVERGGRSAARVKWKDDCSRFDGAVHLLADTAGSIPPEAAAAAAVEASVHRLASPRQRRIEYEGRWCSPRKRNVNKLLWKCPSVMSFCHNQFPITHHRGNAGHNIPHTHTQ